MKNAPKEHQPGLTQTRYDWLYYAGLTIIFLLSFAYIYNEKFDLNGDNCTYYINATAIAQGEGYADISNIDSPPTNTYPPAYPATMAVIRLFTDNIQPQKWMNGIFLLCSGLLLFTLLRRWSIPDSIAFISVSSFFMSQLVLNFATMMMAEMLALFTSVLAVWLITKRDKEKPFFRDTSFYWLIVVVVYSYFTRTQGIALVAAIACCLLINRRCLESGAFVLGFWLCTLPWTFRNKWLGIGDNRYIDMLTLANPWRPDEGRLSLGEYIGRMGDTLQMLFTKALPDSLPPYLDVNYEQATTLGEWMMGGVLTILIVVGFMRLKQVGWLFGLYSLATIGVISLFSTPSGNRYLAAVIPFMFVGLMVGVYVVAEMLMRRLKLQAKWIGWVLLPIVFICSSPRLEYLRAINKSPYPPNYQHFFDIARLVKEKLPPNTVVASRKGNLFYMYSKGSVAGYRWTADSDEVIRGLIEDKVDFVVLEQLGYSSTRLYLYPAIQKNEELFQPVVHLPNPDTYLLRFDREAAIQKLNKTQLIEEPSKESEHDKR